MQLYRYHEEKIRGSRDFPLALYHIEKEHPRYVMNLHWHMETELVHIYSGELQLFLNEREYLLHEGDTAVVAGGVLHSAQPTACVYECLVFHSALLRRTGLEELGGPDGFGQGGIAPLEVYPATLGRVRGMVRALLAAAERTGPGSRSAALGLLCCLWGHLMEEGLYAQSQAKAAPELLRLKEVLRLIEREYPEKLSLEDMARQAGMSPKYFCRFFRQLTHRTPVDYLNSFRVERACAEMEKGEKSLTNIACACGFNDLSYFIRVMRKYKGCTPGQYARARKGAGPPQ